MAKVNRVGSEQSYRTPPEFLRVIETTFGPITFDAACTRANAVAPAGFYHDEGVDALASPWPGGGLTWANPPWRHAGKFAAKAATSTGRVLLLVQAAVGSEWYARYVEPYAAVFFLRPRLTFLLPDGTPMGAGLNRDAMLCAYGFGAVGAESWRWR